MPKKTCRQLLLRAALRSDTNTAAVKTRRTTGWWLQQVCAVCGEPEFHASAPGRTLTLQQPSTRQGTPAEIDKTNRTPSSSRIAACTAAREKRFLQARKGTLRHERTEITARKVSKRSDSEWEVGLFKHPFGEQTDASCSGLILKQTVHLKDVSLL